MYQENHLPFTSNEIHLLIQNRDRVMQILPQLEGQENPKLQEELKEARGKVEKLLSGRQFPPQPSPN